MLKQKDGGNLNIMNSNQREEFKALTAEMKRRGLIRPPVGGERVVRTLEEIQLEKDRQELERTRINKPWLLSEKVAQPSPPVRRFGTDTASPNPTSSSPPPSGKPRV